MSCFKINIRRLVSSVKSSGIFRFGSVGGVDGIRFESTDESGGKPQEHDFIKQLFIDKIREYEKKRQENGGKMFDPIEELERERTHLHEVLLKSFYKTGKPPTDLTDFPTFHFKDEPLGPLNIIEEPKKEKK